MVDDLMDAAEDTECSVVLTGNYTKQRAGNILSGIGGSEMFNTLHSILTVKYCETDEDVRTIVASKMSFKGKERTPVGVRRVDGDTLEFFDYKKWLTGEEVLSRTEETARFLHGGSNAKFTSMTQCCSKVPLLEIVRRGTFVV